MLTDAQRDEFERTGLVRLAGAIPAADTVLMCDRIWEHVEAEHGMRRTEPATWLIEQRLMGLQQVARCDEFERIGTQAVRTSLDELLGEWQEPNRWGGLLVTFPLREKTEWDVPLSVWHNDFERFVERPGLRAVQLFVLLNDVRPRGGATLVLTGSHQLVATYADPAEDGPHPKRLRRELGGAHPWLRELWGRDGNGDRIQRYMVDGFEVDGVPLRVVELAGRAGDVFLMHCDTFHTAAPNCLDQPRMMATTMIRRATGPGA
ncbi:MULTISPECIES: phytanoyl-CoA dioxygenase family protein [unclassified Kribbella]|uniref:phytanoyl-CoA dioxygenase family protein n=1 Tax=unclassified Kribbella TaxID=2644121 RepID=UPI00301651BC